MNTKIAIYAIASLIVGLVLGGIGVAWLASSTVLKDVYSIALSHEVEVAGLCANGLNLLKAGELPETEALLERRLADAIRESERLSAEGGRLAPASPNLREGLRRAADYCHSRHPESDLGARAEALLAK